MFVICVPSALGSQKRPSDLLELELNVVVNAFHMDTNSIVFGWTFNHECLRITDSHKLTSCPLWQLLSFKVDIQILVGGGHVTF